MAAFEFLDRYGTATDGVFDRRVLQTGFDVDGRRVPLVSPQGIFTPRVLDRPLSILTVAPTLREPPPYEDGFTADGQIVYRYRGTDAGHPDNVGLRACMKERLPLVYFFGLVPGKYMASWPVYIIGEDARTHAFHATVEDRRLITPEHKFLVEARERQPERRYLTIETKRRLHQRSFRERVLAAYRSCCAVCRLKHTELLDAAHIIGDGETQGDPVISNGISLCKLHHAAFDRHILGITPEYRLVIRRDILEEHDGPMLRHGLQEVHGQNLHVPRFIDFRPDRDRLDMRYAAFLKAS